MPRRKPLPPPPPPTPDGYVWANMRNHYTGQVVTRLVPMQQLQDTCRANMKPYDEAEPSARARAQETGAVERIERPKAGRYVPAGLASVGLGVANG